MPQAPATQGVTTVWIVLLTATSAVLTLAMACMTPFAAFAALAAVHMRRRDGVALIAAAWVVNQATGFCIMDYPRDATTVAWGGFIGLAAVAAVLVGGAAQARVAAYPARLAVAYVAGFAAFKVVLVVAALFLGDMATSLSLDIAAPQFAREALILAGLLVFYHGVRRFALPTPAGGGLRVA